VLSPGDGQQVRSQAKDLAECPRSGHSANLFNIYKPKTSVASFRLECGSGGRAGLWPGPRAGSRCARTNHMRSWHGQTIKLSYYNWLRLRLEAQFRLATNTNVFHQICLCLACQTEITPFSSSDVHGNRWAWHVKIDICECDTPTAMESKKRIFSAAFAAIMEVLDDTLKYDLREQFSLHVL